MKQDRCLPLLVAIAVGVALLSGAPAGRSAFGSRWGVIDLGAASGRWNGEAIAINDHAQVTGNSNSGGFDYDAQEGVWPTPSEGESTRARAFLWQGGRVRYLGTLRDFPNNEAVAINEAGQIAATAYSRTYATSRAIISRDRRLRALPAGGAESTRAVAILDDGRLVGNAIYGYFYTMHDTYEKSRAVVWQNGKARVLRDLGGPWSEAIGINDRGQIAGSYYVPVNMGGGRVDLAEGHAFRWHAGEATSLTTGRATYRSFAEGINQRGDVVGSYDTGLAVGNGFVWRDGTLVPVRGVPGRRQVSDLAINSDGTVIGTAWKDFGLSGHEHAFLWRRGHTTDLGTLGGSESRATAINDKGQVVGRSTTKQGMWHAFVWHNGTMTDLGTLAGGISSGASALNNHGQIVGWSTARGGHEHAVMWTLRRA